MDLARSFSCRDFSRAVTLLFAIWKACHILRHFATTYTIAQKSALLDSLGKSGLAGVAGNMDSGATRAVCSIL